MKKYINTDSMQMFAFNIWSVETANTVIRAASCAGRDVILQTSVKAFEFVDREELRWAVSHSVKRSGIHAYLHLDHAENLETIQEAVAQGWDSVMIDASGKTLEENIRLTNAVCAIAAEKNVLVETEVGRVGGSEEGVSGAMAGAARIEDIERMIRETGADMLAVAIGTMHGQYDGQIALQYDLLRQTEAISDIPVVIHGGSGLTDQTLQQLLSYGNVKKINISTEVKQAYREGIRESWQKGTLEKEGFDPLKTEKLIRESLTDMVMKKLRLLSG